MVCFIGGIIIYLMSIQNVLKVLFRTIILALSMLLFFGYAGNLRTDTSAAKDLILEIGEATPEFRNSMIPDRLPRTAYEGKSGLSGSLLSVAANAATDIQRSVRRVKGEIE